MTCEASEVFGNVWVGCGIGETTTTCPAFMFVLTELRFNVEERNSGYVVMKLFE